MTISTTLHIRGAVERNGLTWGDVIKRTADNSGLNFEDAALLVDRLERSHSCPLVVAAAVISLVSDLRYAAVSSTEAVWCGGK